MMCNASLFLGRGNSSVREIPVSSVLSPFIFTLPYHIYSHSLFFTEEIFWHVKKLHSKETCFFNGKSSLVKGH